MHTLPAFRLAVGIVDHRSISFVLWRKQGTHLPYVQWIRVPVNDNDDVLIGIDSTFAACSLRSGADEDRA